MIRLLHTADWQIGKPFGAFASDTRALLREARIGTVRRIAALAAEREVEAVLVAGDAFDDNAVSERDLSRTLDALAGFPGPWIFLPGNHDPALPVSVWPRLLEAARGRGYAGIRVADRPEPILLANDRLAVLPAPLVRRREIADLTEWFDGATTPPGTLRVGLAHGSVRNRLAAAAEGGNPISDTRAESAGLAYLALGDWHGYSEIAPRTVYSGTPEPDRYPQNEPGYAVLVELRETGETHHERVEVAQYHWLALTLRLEDGVEALDDALSSIAEPGRCLVDLTLSGALGLRERLDLDAALERWSARLFDLRVEDSELYEAPGDDDLAAIDNSGFVRVAVERLRAKAVDPADPERETAALALRMAFADHRRLRAGR